MNRYVVRSVPWSPFVAAATVALAWALVAGLDTAFERSVLAMMTTVPLSIVVGDSAAATTSPSPTPRRVRWARQAGVGVAVSLCSWVVALIAGGATGADSGWVVEWATVAAMQVVVAVVSARRDHRGNLTPGLLTGGIWIATGLAPRVHGTLHPVADHIGRWLPILGVLALASWVLSVDPAARRRGG